MSLRAYGGKLGDLSRVVVRRMRNRDLTETPYPDIPGQRYGAVRKIVVYDLRVRAHVPVFFPV